MKKKASRKRRQQNQKENAKLRNNVIFGKSIENPMKKLDVTIVTNRKNYINWSFRETIRREKQLDNGLKDRKIKMQIKTQ